MPRESESQMALKEMKKQMSKMGGKTLKKFQESGSPFDKTNSRTLIRPGEHKINKGSVDPDAFNPYPARVKSQLSPSNFQRKGTTVLIGRKGPLSPKAGCSSRPNSAGAFVSRANPPNTDFRRFYERGDLPIQIDHCCVNNKLQWKIEIEKLDYHHYLPLFFSGLREEEEPYNFMAREAIMDMIKPGGAVGNTNGKVLPVLPQLIIPIKEALNTRRRPVVEKTLKILQQLVACEEFVGQALVPYYRQILPIFQIFCRSTENCGDSIVYNQREHKCIGDLVAETLEKFEEHGGEDAFINIKYLIPTYQSIQ